MQHPLLLQAERLLQAEHLQPAEHVLPLDAEALVVRHCLLAERQLQAELRLLQAERLREGAAEAPHALRPAMQLQAKHPQELQKLPWPPNRRRPSRQNERH